MLDLHLACQSKIDPVKKIQKSEKLLNVQQCYFTARAKCSVISFSSEGDGLICAYVVRRLQLLFYFSPGWMTRTNL